MNRSRTNRDSTHVLVGLRAALAVFLAGWVLGCPSPLRAGDEGVASFAPLPGPVNLLAPLALDASSDEVAEDILVDLADWVSPADIASIEQVTGHLEPVSDYTAVDKLYHLHVTPDAAYALARRFDHDPRVEDIEPEHIYQALYEPNDPLYVRQWHMRQVHASQAWDMTEGAGVTVAVIDTGVAYEQYNQFYRVKDLEGCTFVSPRNFVNNTDHANDDHGHGTHVSGTIAQTTNNGEGVVGIGQKIRIMPIKVLDARGYGREGPIAQAIRYAADKGAKVINMSLGGPAPSREMKNACVYAKQKGVTIVCAAGNSAREGVGYPAAFEECIAVSAVRFDETKAWYSSWGKQVAIAAPGGDTQVDQDHDGYPDGVWQNTIVPGNISQQGYLAFQGTSMACPHVAGAAALVIALGVSDPDRVRAVLTSTAKPKDEPKHYGAGLLDVFAAVKKAGFTYDLYRFLLGLCLTALLWRTVRRWGFTGFVATPGYLAGMLLGGTGLFFLPVVGVTNVPLKEFALVGFPQWAIPLAGAEYHMNPITYSALIPVALAVTFFGSRLLRRTIAGFSIGVAAHLLFNALTGMGHMTMTFDLDRTWLLGNAALLYFLAAVLVQSMAAGPTAAPAPSERTVA